MSTQEHAAQARSPSTARGLWPLLGLLFVGIAATYLFFISAGIGTPIPPVSRYFTVLADGFLSGHLSMTVAPSPELLAKTDPYDHANSPLWVWDATLHEGRYYLYWGPVPALLAAAVKLWAGRATQVGDELLVLAFVLGRLAVGVLLLGLALKWLFPRLRAWTAIPAVAVFGLGNPYPFGLGRAAVYEAAIEGAQFFLLAGLLMGLLAIGRSRSKRRERVLSMLAGCAWGAALACRISLLFAVAALVLATAWVSAWGADRLRREAALRLIWIGAPVAFAVLLLGVYNYARFGSWTEVGATHQLGFLPFSFSLFRFLPNLHAYLLREVMLTCEFPFVFAPSEAKALTPAWVFARQTGYLPLEPTVGMLIAVPFVVFGGVAVWTAARVCLQGRPSVPGAAIDPRDRLYVWLVTACLAITLLAGLPALGMKFSTMRFLADFTSGALLAAAVGFWTSISGPMSAARRRVVHAAGALLAVYSVGFSVLLGFQGGYYFSFQRVNLALHEQLTTSLSFCEDAGADR